MSGVTLERGREIEVETRAMWAWYSRIYERTIADVAEKFGLPPHTVAMRFNARGLLAYGRRKPKPQP